MNKKILFLIISAVFAFPVVAGAQTIEGMVDNIITRVVWPVAVGTVIVFWVASGILFLAGMGQPEKIKMARNALIAAVAGTIVIIIAASAMTIIRNALI